MSPSVIPGRDAAYSPGRLKQGSTVYGSWPGAGFNQTSTIILNANTDYYQPGFVSSPIVITSLSVNVTAGAGTNGRIGLYAADRDYQPVGPPLVDSGNLDFSTIAVKTYTPGTPIYVPRGRILGVVNADGAPTLGVQRYLAPQGHANSSIAAAGNIERLRVTRTYAAFPTPGTAWNTVDAGTTSFLGFMFVQVGAG